MSEMSYLEKLLDGVEVEWLPLGNVAEIYGGLTGKSKSDFENGNARYVSYKKIFGYLDVNDYPTDYVYISEGERQNKVRYGDVLFTGSSEIADEAGMSSAVTVHFDESVYLNSFSFGIRFSNSIKIKPEFAKYLFRTHFMRSEIAKTASGVTRFNISKSRFKKILVPIICPNDPEKSLAIQSEIVRILDKFTALTAELTAELNMRKKQYNYYRDQLLSFKEGEVEWKTLGEIGKWYGGGTPSKNKIEFWENGSIPWISPKDMGRTLVDSSEDYITEEAVLQSSTKLIPANSIAIVVRSSILDKVLPSALIKVPATLNQDMKAVIPHENILVKYIYHMIGSRGSDILRAAKKTGGSVASIDSKKLFSFKIPVPNINEQQRIIEILDKFDTLTNSITEGLPREIELRQKQYEYYRDLLFSFPKPETVSN
ncbi:restriction endonuclease subunit S [Escherichia coli]|uniref:restriction endonuclease subunit S n=1 Tax=Escherichia coli TaxID=562 RepID=UPI000DA587CC|nr:restriction endonuclease subunit S [Escherichia coli]SQJ56969.1 type I restriction-modification enzyme S subunit [Escherichia coli]SQR01772.1 type I restriction-modification enzyme S subunit [Escherichia coli]HCS4671100.1 restriction endonuclease subunit S [Escherichia coli]